MTALAWIGLITLAFTATQAWIALRKLRLDLFAKRFETWEAFNDAINERRHRDPGSDLDQPFRADGEMMQRIWRLERMMRVLFPIDVSDCLDRIDKAMVNRDMARMERTAILRVSNYASQADIAARSQGLRDADSEWFEAQDELRRAVHRYVRQYGLIELAGVYARRWFGPQWRRAVERWRRYREGFKPGE